MPTTHSQKKKVIMIMIDTLMDLPLQEALKNEKAPALQFFMENGRYFPNLVCPFPTMSVNVDSTLLTGVYCDKHKVPGLVWYNEKEKRIVNYGSDVKELLKLGLNQSMMDIFYNLNHVHLNKMHATFHETFKEKGIHTGSINALLYRGSTSDHLKIPFLLSLLTGMDRELKTYTPDYFTYGGMHKVNPKGNITDILKKYGFNDKFSANELSYLIREDLLPPFTIAYFPDYDQSVHKNGIMDTKGIQKVDKQLQRILNENESWEDALENNIWIIIGDNGQANIERSRKKALINLRELLSSYSIVKLRRGVTAEDEIVLGVNERMSYIYTLNPKKVPLTAIAQIMQQDYRIDVIACKQGDAITVTSGVRDGQLQFSPNGILSDEYGKHWNVEGDLEILDIKKEGNNITFGEYPDALARLHASLFSHEGEYMVVSAKPGYEFKGESSPTHIGGASHGGLHAQDSLVSMIVYGTNSSPKYLRTVDLKDWLISLI
ncbi:alkaline phosphatase family protein [Oceanobacillus saliphilus]|uniref:alkaline phosphatase family protein n=1 Tax=Oceanobacillus saliphilus TaxID=2925834 RepID=UPI00201D7C70|nr:alkaline phosphatase family protein [Oceanobacillus saliphilus]